MAPIDHLVSDLLARVGLAHHDAELAKFIGRHVWYPQWKPSLGTIARDHSFRIVGTQINYCGKPCWRVLANDESDTFGRVADPDEVALLPVDHDPKQIIQRNDNPPEGPAT